MKNMKIIYDNSPDIFIGSYYCFENLIPNIPLYVFIFPEDKPEQPHIHLINIENQIDIALRLDAPDFYYGHSDNKYYLSSEQKRYINEWMNNIEEDQFGHKFTTYKKIKLFYMATSYKFEENDENFSWDLYFPNEQPNYNLLP